LQKGSRDCQESKKDKTKKSQFYENDEKTSRYIFKSFQACREYFQLLVKGKNEMAVKVKAGMKTMAACLE